jgi:hypothetical protein
MSYDQATQALQYAVSDPFIRQRLIRLRQYGDANRPYAPGDYGFLRSPTLGESATALIDAIATVRPAACFLQNGVDFRPGPLAAAREGFNVRFDIYEGQMSDVKNDSNYRPSQNVRKGYIVSGGGGAGNTCSAAPGSNWPIGAPPRQSTGLLFDRAWPYIGGRMGNGIWDFSTYWQANHGGAGRPPPIVNGAPASDSNVPSRYSVYRYEIDQGFVEDRSLGGETGVPTCYGGRYLPDVADRRILYAAIVNCQSLGLSVGAPSNVPVAAFGKFFITLPVISSNEIFVETVGLVKLGDPANFDMVQLYR